MKTRIARETGTPVTVMSAEELNMDDWNADGPLRWWTVCDTHQTLVGHNTKKEADGWASQPTMWCEECRAARAQ